jgi:5-methylcytosine-specific restriction endonuclease McrA
MMNSRICKTCGLELPIEQFPKGRCVCKECVKIERKSYARKYYEKNKEHIKKKSHEYNIANKGKIKEARKAYRQTPEYKKYVKEYKKKNREKILAQKRASNNRHRDTYIKWSEAHEDELIAKRKFYYEENKEKIFSYIYNKRKTDPTYKLRYTLRLRMYEALHRKSWRKNASSEKLFGADIETVKEYIEKQFKEGMSWENHGEWHIDHIIPLSTAKTKEEMYKLFHYTNLQPLWAVENLKKYNKI